MVVGLGVDIFDVDRIEATLRAGDAALLEQVFTPAEMADCDAQRRPAQQYALRFAAKEAVLKALAPERAEAVPLAWRDIVVDRDADGRPRVTLGGDLRRLANERGVSRVFLSVGCARRIAVASAILESKE